MRRLILDHLPHDQQSDTDEALVRRMVAAQFPQWADLSVRSLAPGGWDNRTFHLGEHMVVRLPSASDYAAQVEKENLWLPRLAPLLPLPIPVPVAIGEPADGYPWRWSVYRWIVGETDFGMLEVGDPACDLSIAWTLFEGKSREVFRALLPLDAGTWARGRAWTLWKALIVAAGLAETNIVEAAGSWRVIDEVLADSARYSSA